MTIKHPPPSPPYLGPAKFYRKGGNKPIRRIVLHGTTGAGATTRGYARRIARYFTSTVTVPSSAHYVVDPGETVQVVGDSDVAFHDGLNVHEIGIEFCDPVVGPITRWDRTAARQMMRRGARLTAELCLAYDVPVRWLGVKRLKAEGRDAKGITDHGNISEAFRTSNHWDLGAFRVWRFMRMVRAEVKALEAERGKPAGPTRVSRAREQIADAIALLKEAPASRKVVHRVASDLDADLRDLPER